MQQVYVCSFHSIALYSSTHAFSEVSGLSLFLQLSQLVKVILISAHLFIRLNHISQYIVQQQIHVAF
jgi:hypothetical protein